MTRTSTFVVVMIGAIIGFALDGDLAGNISDIAAYALGAGTVLSTHYWSNE